jgi:hypothetical protein
MPIKSNQYVLPCVNGFKLIAWLDKQKIKCKVSAWFFENTLSLVEGVHSWPAFGTIFRITDGFRKAGTSLLKRVTGRIFTISK